MGKLAVWEPLDGKSSPLPPPHSPLSLTLYPGTQSCLFSVNMCQVP